MNTYTTKQGDMWDMIAAKALGDTDFTGNIMLANPELLDYYIFPAGIEVKIPEITEEARSDSLPPWKRVSK